MPYSIAYDKKNGIVKLQVSGNATKDEHNTARDESLKLCKDNNCTKLLVDLRELHTELYRTLGCYDFGESVAQKLRGIKIAHVLPLDDFSTREDIIFTSNVEFNRGGFNREFDSIEEAVKWLCE